MPSTSPSWSVAPSTEPSTSPPTQECWVVKINLESNESPKISWAIYSDNNSTQVVLSEGCYSSNTDDNDWTRDCLDEAEVCLQEGSYKFPFLYWQSLRHNRQFPILLLMYQV